jgi:hypothetical protein
MTHPRPRLRVVTPSATDDEVAAIVAAVASVYSVEESGGRGDRLHEWVRSARLNARRAGLQRGPWRLSGRVGRRSRA